MIFPYTQADWNRYGIDFEGPVPVDDDQNVVTVEEPDNILTDMQTEELHRQLLALQSDIFSQQDMLCKYLLAKAYVSQHL